ncbi:hypothetical protein V6N13_085943 [Hibiscus sabdariffa]|uniref:Uncharacterized protein n=1 Tax=Hibiscus sabdariffa TaxID=183260 RepID=A0ABR1ZAH8_9ROSI
MFRFLSMEALETDLRMFPLNLFSHTHKSFGALIMRALRRIVIYLLSFSSRVRLDPESDGSSEGIVPIILLEYSVTNENSCSRNKEISCPEFCCVISITLKQF